MPASGAQRRWTTRCMPMTAWGIRRARALRRPGSVPARRREGGSWVPAPKYGWTWASVVPLATGVMYTNQADVMGAHPVSPQGNL